MTSPRFESLKEALRRRLSPQAYATWVAQMSLVSDDGEKLRLGLPDSFSLNWVNDHYRDVLEEELGPVYGLELVLHRSEPAADAVTARPGPALEIPPLADEPTTPSGATGPAIATPIAPPNNGHPRAEDHPAEDAAPPGPHRLNARYTFSSFVVGPANELAWSACQSLVDTKTPTFNPLVIVGGVGLGKTHLLHGIGHALLKRRPHIKLLLKTSEEFITEVIQGIRTQRMDEFRRTYRACDVLLIDDIQFISGKEACQEEFFHTFNALYDAQKQIVVSSDRLPHEISDIQERVRSRFQWGLIADLKLPELETRTAILKKKAEAEAMPLPDDVALFIAQSVRTNIRELEGCLVRVHAYASLTKQPLTLALAKEVLKSLVQDRGRALTCEVIVKTVAQVFDVKVADLKSTKRARNIALPRQVAMYLCRKHTTASYPEIGQALGGKDHTTALNAFQRISERLADPEVKGRVDEIERQLLE
ncbi:MAG: chromosomal replication initiator protein DnaA [Myxococcota bacterium]